MGTQLYKGALEKLKEIASKAPDISWGINQLYRYFDALQKGGIDFVKGIKQLVEAHERGFVEEKYIKSVAYAWRRIAHKDKNGKWVLNPQVRKMLTSWHKETKIGKEILLTAYSEEPFTISATDIENFVDKYNEIISYDHQISYIFNDSFEKYLYLNSMEDIDRYRHEIFEYGWQCIKNLLLTILSIECGGVPQFVVDKLKENDFGKAANDLIKSISNIFNDLGKVNKYEADLYAIKIKYEHIRKTPQIISHFDLQQIRSYKETVLSTYEGLLRTLGPSDIQETSKARLSREAKRIINKGEGDRIEFKSSFRWDYKENRKNNELKKEVVKTIAAFLNTKGGTLFIGIDNDGNVVGIEKDIYTFSKNKQDWDCFYQTLINAIENYIGGHLSVYLNINNLFLNGKMVAMIEVEKSPYPVYFRDKQEEKFYIRLGNTTREIRGENLQKYIDSRF